MFFMKPAFLVVDMQNLFYGHNEVTRRSLEEAQAMINAVIPLFRAKKLPVVWVQHCDAEDGLVPGAKGFDLPEAFVVAPEDLRVVKEKGNAFCGTDLDERLRSLGVDTVIFAGFCAEFCVLSSCRGARDLGYSSILLRGGLASICPENIPFVERVNELISCGALGKVLDGIPA
jgi:nicotinamidase-related amidase